MKTSLLASAAALLFIVGTASAADFASPDAEVAPAPMVDEGRFYVSLFGGASFSSDVDGQYYGSSNLDLQMDTGFLVGATVGAEITSYASVEFEASYTQHDVNDDCFEAAFQCAEGGFGDEASADGEVGVIYMLGNVWVHPFSAGRFSPYIGGGVGAAYLRPDLDLYEDEDDFGFFCGGDGGCQWTDGRLAAAGQLGAGVQFAFTDRLSLDLGYRAKAVLGGTFADEDSCDESCSAVDVTWVDHNVQLGLKFGF